MGGNTKSERDYIVLLLAIIDQSKETNWNKVAEDTGLYKSGKFVKQALDGIKKKYPAGPTALPTPNSTKVASSVKKNKQRVLEENSDDEPRPSKKQSKKSKIKTNLKDESEEEALNLFDNSD